MHIEFQNGAAGEYVNISKIAVNNEMERDILIQAVKEFDKENREDRSAQYKYKEGDIVVVITDDCRLPKNTICVIEKTLPAWGDSVAFCPIIFATWKASIVAGCMRRTLRR